jgi:hypothetical protein
MGTARRAHPAPPIDRRAFLGALVALGAATGRHGDPAAATPADVDETWVRLEAAPHRFYVDAQGANRDSTDDIDDVQKRAAYFGIEVKDVLTVKGLIAAAARGNAIAIWLDQWASTQVSEMELEAQRAAQGRHHRERLLEFIDAARHGGAQISVDWLTCCGERSEVQAIELVQARLIAGRHALELHLAQLTAFFSDHGAVTTRLRGTICW